MLILSFKSSNENSRTIWRWTQWVSETQTLVTSASVRQADRSDRVLGFPSASVLSCQKYDVLMQYMWAFEQYIFLNIVYRLKSKKPHWSGNLQVFKMAFLSCVVQDKLCCPNFEPEHTDALINCCAQWCIIKYYLDEVVCHTHPTRTVCIMHNLHRPTLYKGL